MDFSSLVLMEKDKETGYIKKELGSFQVGESARYVKKLFTVDNTINLYFDTDKDVSEWEYSAIYDLFNEEVFVKAGYDIEMYEEEYNPTYIVKTSYVDDYEKIKEKLNEILILIEQEMENVFKAIEGKESEYNE